MTESQAATKSSSPAWFAMPAEDVAKQLQVDPAQGLTAAEAQTRLAKTGRNELAAKKKEPGWQAFLRQYQDFMQIILLGAAAVNLFFTGEWATTIVLVLLTISNAVLGLRGEFKAEASLAALTKMMKNIARVRRDGQAIEIEAEELVPGDIVLMEAGNRVPADGRLFVAATMEIEEAALTGESVATLKDTAPITKPEVPLGDRINMAFMNTAVTRGRGEMIVTTTGMATEMGHIADLLNKTEADKTPLQKQLDRLTLIIAGLAGLAFLAMIVMGLRQGVALEVIFISGIALAISAIPTGLPAVVTTMYSMGTRALAQQNAIVKRLPSVETLGSVSAICSDKTGTLTLNKMTAREFTIPGQNHYKVTGEGYSTKGELLHSGGTKIDLDAVLLPMALCADARLDGEALIGDPTEGALIVLAAKGGINLDGARERYPRVAEVPFDSDYKFMATFHKMKNEQGKEVIRCFVKGAPDVLIARGGSYLLPDGQSVAITDENSKLAIDENDRMAKAGERVMVVARKDFDPATFDPKGKLIELVKDLTLLAMVGIVDPPRARAKDAIAKCHSAGIQVRMITGDHAVTAAAIGHELGIEGTALTGAQFAAIPDDQLKQQLDEIGVVARVAPEDKIRLVHLLQEKQNIVAMTGDGVNDAPALKKADIGVAMGITGTEVLQGRGGDDPDRRQLRHHRQGGGVWPPHLQQSVQLRAFPDGAVGGVHCFLPAGSVLHRARRDALHAGRGAVLELSDHRPSGHRPGLRQTSVRPDGTHTAAAQATCVVQLSVGAYRLHRHPDGARHGLSGGAVAANRCDRCRQHGFRRLLLDERRHGAERPQRDRLGAQPGHLQRSEPADALRPGTAHDAALDRAWFLAAHAQPHLTHRRSMAVLYRLRHRPAARRRSDQGLPASTAQPPRGEFTRGGRGGAGLVVQDE